MNEVDVAVYNLTRFLIENEREPRNSLSLVPNVPIMTRRDLQKIKAPDMEYVTTTSGSTGEPVTVTKSIVQHVWFQATNLRELIWRNWDTQKNLAMCTARIKQLGSTDWKTNPLLFKQVGKIYTHPLRGDLQKFIDEVDAEYFYSYPSIIKRHDVSKFIDIKSTGEQGATMYSSEELGTIAITCPDNPDVYHVMENIIVEIDDDHNIICTDITHPYLKRYMIGDKGDFATCSCGRKLQTLNKQILGRERNMATAPDGSKFWPKVGSIKFNEVAPNLKQFQVIQEPYEIILKVEGLITEDEEKNLLGLIEENMGSDFKYRLIKVDGFPAGKFEEFVSNI